MPLEFLWGGRERPDTTAFTPRSTEWWRRYSERLLTSGFAKRELEESCRGIVSLLPDPREWSSPRQAVRGLVVGAVQSGKTASMIGVTAVALDQGYRVVVILSGGKDDLRRQTARRFNTQLLRMSEEIPGGAGATTLDASLATGGLPAFALPYHQDAHQYGQFHLGFQGALRAGHAAVIVIKKHVTSLADVRQKLEIAYQRMGVTTLPTLVLDDECDEGSVDREGMPLPAAIAGLWRRDAEHPHVAYVGYTATSAANLLQRRDNELFPTDFVCLLRFPGPENSTLTFDEGSADNWYTGGEAFYEDFGTEPGPADNFMVVPAITVRDLQRSPFENVSLLEAVRAFIVAGAYRLALEPGWSLEDSGRFPACHTMLVQTSASQDDHRVWCEDLVRLFDGGVVRGRPEYRWRPASVLASIDAQEDVWRTWYDAFSRSRNRVLAERSRIGAAGIATWEAVRGQITSFVEHLRIKIVNSDEEIGTELDFAPRPTLTGTILPPKDLFTLVIGGAKLSRGLTVEGLGITYFARQAATPTEDTVLQLSRWYGYRGRYLEFCRLFTTPALAEHLRELHGNDTHLREQLASLMTKRRAPADAALVIRSNPRALPTAKRGEGRLYDLAFSPFATVFRHVEFLDEDLARGNEAIACDLVRRIRERVPEEVRAAGRVAKGLLSRDWTAVEVADVLDSLGFSDHNPSTEGNPAREFYREADVTRPIVAARQLTDDPYQVAAYLRQWAAEGGVPSFNVGYAYGELGMDTEPFDFPLVNREVVPLGQAVGGWTGRSADWPGDQHFDDAERHYSPGGGTERSEFTPGFLLLYVVHRAARGRHGRGTARRFHSPLLGVVIPAGGPTWRRVTVDRRRVVTS